MSCRDRGMGHRRLREVFPDAAAQALTVRRVQVRVETVVAGSDLEVLHPLYLRAFAPLVTRAAARHVLTRAEFDGEMADPRILKVVVRDDEDVPVGLTTLTRDLTAVPWVNPSYFWTRFPDAAGREALFYLGYIFIDPERRRSHALLLMASEIKTHLEEVRGVIGFDTSGFTDEHGIGRWSGWLFGPRSTVSSLDTQTYSVADYRTGRAPAEAAYPRQVPTDDLRLVTLAERPDLADEIGALLSSRWPIFMLAGQAGHDEDLDALVQTFPEHQVLAVDPEDRVRAVAFSLPIDWDGSVAGLPAGWDDAVGRAAALGRAGGPPTAATALSITVASDLSRRGLAVRLIDALGQATRRAGGHALIAPVRPVLKHRYPLVDLDEYLSWRTAEGEVFDPWVRTHLRAGARLVGVAPASMTITGSVDDWRTWVEDPLPGPGSYVVPGALAPLTVADGVGTYVEANVWLVHDVGPTAG
jgi:GNAT superfamily N-acetyltransferase